MSTAATFVEAATLIVCLTFCAADRGSEAGLVRAEVEEREVGRGSGTLRGSTAPVEDTTLLPGRPKAPPSFVRSVGVGRPGVVALV